MHLAYSYAKQPWRYSTLLLAAVLLAAAPAQGAGLYSIGVPSTSQSPDALQDGIKKAFRAIMVKLTGDTSALQHPAVRTALKHADRWVQSFAFEPLPAYWQTAPGHSWQYWLNIRFSSSEIRRILRAADLPLWQRPRNPLLLWLAVQQNDEASILSGSQHADLRNALWRAMDRSGMKAALPAMDETDQKQITPLKILAAYDQDILRASQRYPGHDVVYGTLSFSNGTWSGHFAWQENSHRDQWELSQNADPESLFMELNQHIAHSMAGYYATRESRMGKRTEQVVYLHINALDNLEDMARLEQDLDRIRGVKSLSIRQINSKQVSYLVHFKGDIEQLANKLRQRRNLQEQVAPANASGLHFRYMAGN